MTDNGALLNYLLHECDESMTVKEAKAVAEKFAKEQEEEKGRKLAEEKRRRKAEELEVLKEFIADLKNDDVSVVLRTWGLKRICLFNQLHELVEKAMTGYMKDLGERLERKLPELEKLECKLIELDDER